MVASSNSHPLHMQLCWGGSGSTWTNASPEQIGLQRIGPVTLLEISRQTSYTNHTLAYVVKNNANGFLKVRACVALHPCLSHIREMSFPRTLLNSKAGLTEWRFQMQPHGENSEQQGGVSAEGQRSLASCEPSRHQTWTGDAVQLTCFLLSNQGQQTKPQ